MEQTLEWKESFFKLSNGIEFSIVHNLPTRGNINSIDAALDNWLARTKKFTRQSFIDYINSKGIYTAMTKNQYDQLNKP